MDFPGDGVPHCRRRNKKRQRNQGDKRRCDHGGNGDRNAFQADSRGQARVSDVA
jgi:hypothetical protein